MDLDRRKHDLDIIERVLGGIRDDSSDIYTRVVDVDVRPDDDDHPTLELTIGLADSDLERPMRR